MRELVVRTFDEGCLGSSKQTREVRENGRMGDACCWRAALRNCIQPRVSANAFEMR
jgi:hypothetical protein